ncbi:serum amyloid A-1 protein-like [Ruditapes philippinarum]|uniref:serum amyloid A-1 protein-like n=1 Tax=Ruditapes philippinarum TaxID=129788 RepID=UPI00295BE9B1|nr:serum amyloid A-1 protein-like [Ruditapes philippinarum]
MYRAYSDMKESDWKYSDKYFHARGNYDAAQHGTGGRHAAKVISDAREVYGFFFGDSPADRAADQEANEHGRNGGDPNKYRPRGLPKKYKK